jgi:hypothetical protein
MHSIHVFAAVLEQNLQEKWQAWQFPTVSMKNFELQTQELTPVPAKEAFGLQETQLVVVIPLQVLQV